MERFKTYKDDPERRKREVIPGTYDIVFKSAFIKVEGLIDEVVTGVDNIITKEDMKDKKIINSELIKETIFEKGKVSDLVIEIKNKIINIEMNRVFYDELIKRNSTYASKIQSLYEDKYVIQINIDDFSAYDNESSLIKFQMISDKNQIDETFIIKYHVNLEVIKNKYYNKEELTRLEKILLMLKLVNREELIKLSKGDTLMERIYEELDKMSKDKESLLSYSKYELEMEGFKEKFKKEAYEEAYDKYHGEGLEEGRKEGIKEGREEGIKDRNIEIAKNMINLNIDLEVISKVTGLQIKEIENLKIDL